MLRGRAFLVKVVKDPDALESEVLEIDFHEVARVITKSVSTCITVYIGMDILRRVIIYATTSKI